MKTGITENKDELIAQLLYQGVPRDEIEKRASTNAGHISKVLQREEELIGEGNVKALRRLAKALPKNRQQLSIVDIHRDVIFLNSCNAMDLSDGEVRDAMPRIVECCKKSGIAPKDLPLDIESKATRLEVLKSEIDAGEKGALEAKKRREEALREAGLTNEALSRFNIYMNMLAKRGLPLDPQHPEKLENALANAEEAGHDAKSIIDEISQTRSLKERKASLQSDISRQEEQLRENNRILEQQRREIGKHSDLVETIRDADRMGFGTHQLRIIMSEVKRAGAENGIDAPTAMQRFIEDVNIGLGTKMSFAKAAEEGRKRCQELRARTLEQQRYYEANKGAVDSALALQVKGIKADEIVSLKNIIVGCGGGTTTSIKEIEEQVRLHGSLKNSIQALKKEERDLMIRKQTLEGENDILSANNEGLKKAGENVTEIFKKVVENYMNLTGAATDYFLISIAKSGKVLEKRYDESGNIIRQSAVEIKEYLEAAKSDFQKVLDDQRFLQFEALVRAGRGEKVSQRAIAKAMIRAIDCAEHYLDNMVLESPKRYLRAAREELIQNLDFFPTLLE
jgi:hypothetical protein